MKHIRALIVDDEPLARARLRRFLAGEDDIEIVAEAGDGREALKQIAAHKPDLLFLDIQMPEIGGFDVLTKIPREQRPVVIFVTAYDRYAIQAFEVHALDYLLKPYSRERFSSALARARQQFARSGETTVDERMRTLLAEMAQPPKHLQRLMIRSSGRIYFINTKDVDWIGAEGNYLALHVGSETHLLRETMSHLAMQLEPARFVRIHRSTIVNVERVKELQPLFSGDYVAVLRDGKQLNLSRAYREEALKAFAAPA